MIRITLFTCLASGILASALADEEIPVSRSTSAGRGCHHARAEWQHSIVCACPYLNLCFPHPGNLRQRGETEACNVGV